MEYIMTPIIKTIIITFLNLFIIKLFGPFTHEILALTANDTMLIVSMIGSDTVVNIIRNEIIRKFLGEVYEKN